MALIPITLEDNTTAQIEITLDSEKEFPVNGRQLYVGLQVKAKFADWIKRMVAYGFIENQDYIKQEEVFLKNEKNPGGRPVSEYYLTVDMAKHLCMIQRSNIGMQIRNYFIQVEKEWRQHVKPMTPAEMLYAAAGQLLEHEHKLTQHDQKISELLVNQAALVTYNMRNIVGLKSVNKDQQRQLDKHEEDISTIKQAFNAEVSLREEIKTIVEIAVHAQNMKHQDAYNIVYDEIQKELGINLTSRVNNIKKRLQKSGASKSKIEAVSKLDAIEQDPSLYKPIRKILAFLREAAAT